MKDVKEGKIVLIQGSFVPQVNKTAFRKVAPLYVQPIVTETPVVEEKKEEVVVSTPEVKVETKETIVDSIKEEPVVEEKEVEPTTEEKE